MEPLNFDTMVVSMLNTEQTKGMSVYQHGIDVNKHFNDLHWVLSNDQKSDDWKIPNCVLKNAKDILANLHEIEIISKYVLFHDCSKPYVRIVDEEGKVHFPNHAEESKNIFYKLTGNEIVSNLIGWDMDLHSKSSLEIEDLLKSVWSKKDALTLLLVTLSELHSNAKMFGGIESISFKTKYTKIERRAKQICKYYFGEKNA